MMFRLLAVGLAACTEPIDNLPAKTFFDDVARGSSWHLAFESYVVPPATACRSLDAQTAVIATGQLPGTCTDDEGCHREIEAVVSGCPQGCSCTFGFSLDLSVGNVKQPPTYFTTVGYDASCPDGSHYFCTGAAETGEPAQCWLQLASGDHVPSRPDDCDYVLTFTRQ